ncbi:bi-domain-containing oxidoreductase [Thalassospira xiamenensis]|uniref:bi-domain-containing oxidoreductase n=1 Tax=Thalassospira xiamenensis TaxID=220697 RepID=UPI003AA87BDB
MTDMRALLRFPGERRLAVADCPVPALLPGTILVRTEISVISNGTERQQASETKASLIRKAWQRPDLVALTIEKFRRDGAQATLNAVKGRLGRPMATGYANCGTVEAMASDVTDFDIGQRVACAGMEHANHAEYNIVPRNLACPVPNTVSDEMAAFATLYAIGVHAAHQGELEIGQKVAVIGCGLIGQIVTQITIAAGAIVTVIEPFSERRKKAEESGVKYAYADISIAPVDQFDAVLVCSNNNKAARTVIESAAKLCRDRGIIVCVGDVAVNAPRNILYRKEITIRQVRSYGPGRYDANYEQLGQDYPIGHARWTVKRNMAAALSLMESGKLDPASLISHRINLHEASDFLSGGDDPTIMATVIKYHRTDSKPQPPAPVKKISKPNVMPVRIGLIGAGNYMNSVLLPRLKLRKKVALNAVVSGKGLSALAICRHMPDITTASDPDEILSNHDINTVFIATRHDSHADLASKALGAGKHVWLEKPLCIHPKQIGALQQAAGLSQTQVFMVGHNRRFAQMTARLKQHLVKGKKQFRYQVRPNPLPSNHWLYRPDQGGRTIGEISHFIDLIGYLTGAEMISLSCDWIDRKAGDSVWYMHFADGSRGEVSYMHAARRNMPKETLEVLAPGFSATIQDWRKLVINGNTVMRKGIFKSPDKGHDNAIDCFIDAVSSGIHDHRMQGIAAEISLMDQILSAAEGSRHDAPA